MSVLLPLFSYFCCLFRFLIYSSCFLSSFNIKKKHEKQGARVMSGNECATGCAFSTRLDYTGDGGLCHHHSYISFTLLLANDPHIYSLLIGVLFYFWSSCIVYLLLYYPARQHLDDFCACNLFCSRADQMFVCLFVHRLISFSTDPCPTIPLRLRWLHPCVLFTSACSLRIDIWSSASCTKVNVWWKDRI